MSSNSGKLRVGILGMGRTAAFMKPVMEHPHATLIAVCDRIPGKTAAKFEKLDLDPSDIAVYDEYETMLEEEELDVVVVGSSVADHVPHSIMALAEDIHVYSEVSGAWDLEQARDLFLACQQSRAKYMMGENSCYHRHNMTALGMVREGLLGHIHYGEGEYIHELIYLIPKTPWRESQLFGVNGLLYTTHDLGPILAWMDWDRVVSVSAAGGGSHFRDQQGEPYALETRLYMQCKTEQGRLIRIGQDFASPCAGYHHRYVIQGVEGRFESPYRTFPGQIMSTRLPNESGKPYWDDIKSYEEKYLPEIWKRLGSEAMKHGHGGTDYVIMHDFLDAIWNDTAVPFDIWKSLNMTLPGIMSVESLKQDGAWVDVPDPKDWAPTPSAV